MNGSRPFREMRDNERDIYSRETGSLFGNGTQGKECWVYMPIMRKWKHEWLAQPK